MVKRFLAILLAAALFCAAFWAVQSLLVPKYMQKPFEGALTAEYYQNARDNDLLVIGDCEVYENLSPVVLWEQFGVPCYIRGNAKQLMWQSRALLEDALRYETPRVVLLSVLAMMYGTPQRDSEAYNRMTLDGLRFSPIKWRAVRDSALPDEEKLSYLLPLLRFHSRWAELKREDFRYFCTKKQVSINGFVMRADTRPADWLPEAPLLPSYTFGAQAVQALEAITALCRQKGIQLVLFKAPSLSPYWYPEWDAQIVQFAQKNNLLYLNTLEQKEEVGLDYSKDTYDGGLHLNLQGAEKLARYVGRALLQYCPALSDRRDDPRLAAAWNKRAAQYRALQTAQIAEFATGGKVKSLLVSDTE